MTQATPVQPDSPAADTNSPEERLRRWRLILGGEAADGTGVSLHGADLGMDRALGMLYDADQDKGKNVGMGSSAPRVARWLGDIRNYFPSPVVRLMQKDALERLDLKQMLLEPELLRATEPDVNLVATLLTLKNVIPTKTKDTARQVVRRVADDLEHRLANPLRQAITGSLNRAVVNRHPRHNEINWPRTLRANLKHYQPAYRTIIPVTRIGHGRKTSALRDIILCVDQSGSMATSVVYASIMAAVMASLRAVSTSFVVYDTSVVDLTAELHDPVDVLFGTQLGGGNDTPRALTYCQQLVRRPQDTLLILISDLHEGAMSREMIQRMASIVASGVQAITLLALDDQGAPSFDRENAAAFAQLGVPCFACTPDQFPAMMAAAIERRDMQQWAAAQGIVVAQ
jgi:Mg-chelatase subunit ChlD